MQNMKKLVSVLLTLVMVLALTVPAFAADDYSITIENSTSGYTYEAYQIFAGDLSDKTLSNIVWGADVTEAGKNALGNAADKAASLKTVADAEAFAKAVAPYLDSTPSGSANTCTNGKYVISGLAAGYYLVKDTTVPGDGAHTSYLLKVVANTTAVPKSAVPTSEKKVKDTNDSVANSTTGWQDSADYDIGDSVPFLLKGTVANNYDNYTAYKFVFHDEESSGLDFDSSTVVVKVDGTLIESGYTVVTENLSDDCTFEVRFENLKNISAVKAGSVITVEYESTLTEGAAVGAAGNTNKMKLEYSNDPNWNGEGTEPTGNTPEDTVVVFTYKTIINKITKNPDYDPEVEGSKEYIPLTGAEFTLEKKILGDDPATNDVTETEYWKPIAVVKNDEGTTFTFSGLDDGDYRLTETTTPAGYNTVAPIEFTITAEHNIDSANPAITSLAGTTTGGALTFTPVISAGSLTADVVNNAGATLPETGGIGTTIFYVLGSILVLGAGILLVTKKRMSVEQ